MKFKVGQKIRMIHNEDEAQECDIGIIRGKSRGFENNQDRFELTYDPNTSRLEEKQ